VTTVTFGGATMAEIAADLGAYVDRIVIDETGLAGTYDVNLLMFAVFVIESIEQPTPN
jgi:uncharacterized protein (TIGR03435 family)